MSDPVDLLSAMGVDELIAFLWLVVLLDVPRYFIATIVLAIMPPARGTANKYISIDAVIAAHNEAHGIGACIRSLHAAGAYRIIVVNDGSTDTTADKAREAGATVIDLPERVGKPLAINEGLKHASARAVLIADADTIVEPGALHNAATFLERGVGGVSLNLTIGNEAATLTTRYQAIEYAIIMVGRRMTDALGILSNVSGAAGLFRRKALTEVGGLDCEVAEDAALAMKLRVNGWQLRFAPNASASAATHAPETVTDILLQRLRWDASIITIWWRKYGRLLWPLSHDFTWPNFFASLDIFVFSIVLALALPVYFAWLVMQIGFAAFVLLGAVMVALVVLDAIVLFVIGVPLRLLPYVPYYVVTQTIVMRPLRVIALLAELLFSITRRDDYIPKKQRWRLT